MVTSTQQIRPTVQRAFVGGILLLLVLSVVHRETLFVLPWHEHSDYAVDALHIERARHFEAIHGNFSRFGFHHPGPAFYYVYALGEQLLYRWLQVVPSPYNAHVISGLVLQGFFFWAAVVICARWIRRPLFIPLALFAFAVHLQLADHAFISTWPPHVLLMPFLCFLVGVSSIAAGNISHLPITVLAGCFLVHGHVAQPLYVVPLFSLAYGTVWWREGRRFSNKRAFWRASRAPHLLSGVCIAVFLVPLVIDVCAGAQSNFAKILEFETSFHDSSKPLWKAIVYFVSFFGYVKKQELFLSIFGPERSAAIGEHVLGYWIWGVMIAAVLSWIVRSHLERRPGPPVFVRVLTGFTACAFLLSLYWGTVQIGPMYEYNGYFFYAILGCVLLLFCALVSALPFPHQNTGALILYAAAAVVGWQRQYTPLPIDYTNRKIPPAVRQALASDPRTAAPKYLLFNRGDWGEAVSIALALAREGREFRADADWGTKFAPDAEFEPAPPAFDFSGVSTWRLSRAGPSNTGSLIRDNLRVYFEPLPFDPHNATIDCSENGNLELYTLFGFTSPLESATWTIRPYAGLVFDSPPISSDLSVTFFAEPFACPGIPGNQPMTLTVNGQEVFTTVLKARGAVATRIPAAVWNSKKPVLMAMHFPAAVAPAGSIRQSIRSLGGSIDKRMFGWRIERVVFESAR